MTTILFPDNTVLINFALLNRVDILDRIMRGQGRWCAAVSDECAQSAKEVGLEAMAAYPAILGSPLFPATPAEHLEVRLLRDRLVGPGDGPTRHLGEAETVAIISGRQIDAVFATDDRDARMLADMRGITTYTTWDLLRLAGKVKLVDPDTLWGYVLTLRARARGNPPGVHDRRSFDLTWFG